MHHALTKDVLRVWELALKRILKLIKITIAYHVPRASARQQAAVNAVTWTSALMLL